GDWALMTFIPIRDIQLTRSNIATLARQAGDEQTAAYFEDKNSPNPSTVKNSPAWAGAEKLFYLTTNWVTGKYGKGFNLSDHTDFQYLPGKRYDTFFDPEGFLSTIPAVATCLLGVFAGLLLKSQTVEDRRKVVYLIGFGVAAVAAGWLWNLQFPVVKKIWTSSYVLVAGRIQRNSAGRLLFGGGCVGEALLVPAARVDRHELNHHLSGEEHSGLRRDRQDCRPVWGRSYRNGFGSS